jgi:hypothetical protein
MLDFQRMVANAFVTWQGSFLEGVLDKPSTAATIFRATAAAIGHYGRALQAGDRNDLIMFHGAATLLTECGAHAWAGLLREVLLDAAAVDDAWSNLAQVWPSSCLSIGGQLDEFAGMRVPMRIGCVTAAGAIAAVSAANLVTGPLTMPLCRP